MNIETEVLVAYVYRNLKTGDLYRVMSIPKHHETREPWVAYMRLKDETDWIRPMDEFIHKFALFGPFPLEHLTQSPELI
jgi:hypothetical protein